MRILKRRGNKRRPGLLDRLSQSYAALRFAERLKLGEQGLAAYLGRKTAYWDRRSKILALALFVLLFGGLSMWLLVKAWIHF